MKSQAFANRLRVKAQDKLGTPIAKPATPAKKNSDNAAENDASQVPF
jgi:hypothetical protein